jgi:hypothetical protein
MPGFGRSGRPGKPLAIAVGAILLFIVGWVVVSRLSASFSDRYESFYPSLADAEKDGAITRGWIPDDLLPSSSHAIHEVHDLSPSTQWCAFEFDPADSQRLRKNLKSVDLIPAPVRRLPNPQVSWWPRVLKGKLDMEAIHKEKFELYAVERPETSVTTEILLFAIDWPKGRGYFYSTSE